MEWYWWLAISLLVWWGGKRLLANTSETLDRKVFSLISPFLKDEGFDLPSISYSVYRNDLIEKERGTCIFVGYGQHNKYSDGRGFLIEATDVGQVIESLIMEPGAAAHHKRAAQEAKHAGITLKALLQKHSDAISRNRQGFLDT